MLDFRTKLFVVREQNQVLRGLGAKLKDSKLTKVSERRKINPIMRLLPHEIHRKTFAPRLKFSM